MNTIFEKGLYILGDLGYVMTDKQWKEACAKTTDDEYEVGTGKVKTLLDGTIYGIMGTQHGDGCYASSIDENFPVDSGTIGCMKVTETMAQKLLSEFGHLVSKVRFYSNFTIFKEANGTLYFDKVAIYTDPSYIEDEEDDVSQDEF